MVGNRGTQTPSNLFDNDIPDSLQENPPLMSESHASNLGSATMPNILDLEKVTRDTVYSNNEAINDLPDSPQEIPHLTSEPRASDLDSASPSDDPYSKETFGNFPDTLPEIPHFISEPHESNLGCVSPSDVSARKQISKSEACSHPSASPILERDPHTSDNFTLDHLVGTHTSIDSSTVNDTVYDDQACTSENTFSGSRQSNGHTKRNILAEHNVSASRTVLSAAADTKDYAETDQRNGENSSQMFGLGHRLLIKSFNYKVSFDEKSGPYGSLKSVILEQSEQNGIVRQPHPETTFKEKVSFRYPIDSLPPSPPLEHMKISFQPLSGLETSKLKLQFPDGSNHHERITDMFPSFQLVPESSIPMDDSGSHSDGDDTFCRSSPCASYDRHTPRSDYDSDQWESDETSGSSGSGGLGVQGQNRLMSGVLPQGSPQFSL
ncbi:hypothetical protein KIW84_056122 [Lathyrus oleraceus]|uniref:Protein SCAR n=1 Tax=Pisum sativum TaxID=3888 RepID=A0A9D4WZN5_PEA|nr:hypothetical protein KIW84_056122 [Pisum sativum]